MGDAADMMLTNVSSDFQEDKDACKEKRTPRFTGR
jgi:hypothetical protein